MNTINTPKLLAILEDIPIHGEFSTKYSLYKGEYFQVEIDLEYDWGELDPEAIQVFDDMDLVNKTWQHDIQNTWTQIQSLNVPLGSFTYNHPTKSNFILTIVTDSHTVQMSWNGTLPDQLSPLTRLVSLLENHPTDPS